MPSLFRTGVSLSLLFFALSAALQAPGLWGPAGVSPLRWPEFLDGLARGEGAAALAWTLVVLACLSFVPRARLVAWILFYPFALPLMDGGGPFLFYQWDVLLLEVLVLAALLELAGESSRWPVWAGRAALFKLMFLSGCVKLQSGDPNWWGLTALDYHFWTQPLPTPLAFYADALPAAVKKLMTLAALALEIGGAFLLFTGRRARRLVAGLFIGLQLSIALTGNYAFFNLLSASLALFGWIETAGPGARARAAFASSRVWGARALARGAGAALVLLSLGWCVRPFLGDRLRLLDEALLPAAAWRVNSGYGLFAIMTTERTEISIEASRDGVSWEAYRFRWKPDAPGDCGAWIAPHQPRLDWQMWFLSLALPDPHWAARSPWFLRLLDGLARREPSVLALMGEPPFGGEAPRLLRVRARDFTPNRDGAGDGCWRAGEYRELLPAFPPDALTPYVRDL